MEFQQTILLAIHSIKTNKLRSILTSLGIIIGVASVILLISIGSGLQSYISSQFEKLGTNSIFIVPGKIQVGPQGGPPRSVNKLTFSVVKRIEQQKGRFITDVTPFIEINITASNKNKSKVTTLVGTESPYFATLGIETAQGRLFTEADDRRSRKVAVIGQTIAKELYGSQTPINKPITLSGKKFTVIGVLEKEGNVGGIDVDNQVAVPLATGRILTGTDQVNSVLVKTTSTSTLPQAKKQIQRTLNRVLSEDDYTILTQEQLLSSILQIVGVLTYALGGIAAISLIVGGVGISNIMLVSVTERTREIGLRKAVGARPADILSQFLIEAVILSLFGGIIGVLIGYGGSLILANFLQTSVPLWSVLLGLGFSTAVGIVFGVFPAIRAARFEPIEALRHE